MAEQELSPEDEERFWRHYEHGLEKGLTEETAYEYATLVWWGEWYGIPAATITSGRRSIAHQRTLRERWARGDRRGISSRPALNSRHVTGQAFDIRTDNRNRTNAYAYLAQFLNLRWGGDFSQPDPGHFDYPGSSTQMV